jgi:hypothetical protein
MGSSWYRRVVLLKMFIVFHTFRSNYLDYDRYKETMGELV